MRRAEVATPIVGVIEIPRLERMDETADQEAVYPLRTLALGAAGAANLTPQHDRPPSAPCLLMMVAVAANVRGLARKR